MPEIDLPSYMKLVMKTKAPLVVLYGGRGAAKSKSLGRLVLHTAQTERADWLCGREYQNSIELSVHKVLKNLIENLPVNGFKVHDEKIDCTTGGMARFKGFHHNSQAVKSAEEFKYCWIEQAEDLSQDSIDDLLPTILRNPGSKIFFTANPQSSADPFSKAFILPFENELHKNRNKVTYQGHYEDDMHLIIKANWRDNDWHEELEPLRQKDFDTMTRAKYDWMWEGSFNDSVEDSLILAEWFDACIDAHKKLGFEPLGMRISSHDPSDTGPDNKGYVLRHGSVVLQVKEKVDGDVNEGCDWATGLAITNLSDAFTWDCDGMGAGLKAQVSAAFNGKPVKISMFKGSESVDNPDAIYQPVDTPIQNQLTNKNAIRNKRAQYYLELRRRIYKTYQAVVKGVYNNPDEMLSFDSSIDLLPKLRSELCRMPIKPNGNGLFEMYTKEQMKTKFKYDSPNLADSLMMSCRQPHINVIDRSWRPQPIKVISDRRR